MNVFDLVAKISLDSSDYEKGLSSAGKKIGTLGSTIKSALSTAAKVSSVAIGAAGTAISFVTKAAVGAYSEYEQLEGGVKKLFDSTQLSLEEYAASVGRTAEDVAEEWSAMTKGSQTVLNNASNAYKSVGISTNEYIQSITAFSAAMLNSVGGDSIKAAEMSDKAMRDIADNANTFGVYTVEQLTGVYQALAKGQYQTLDNLNLGFGGTKEGMKALIEKANALKRANGEMGNLTIDKFSDIVEAIHTVQVDMNIYQTTANEAERTIQGSINATKAAWKDLLLAFGRGEGIKQAIGTVVSNAKNVVNNVKDVAITALAGIGEFVKEVGPIIIENLPQLVSEVLPPLLEAAVSLVGSLAKALPGILVALLNVVKSFMGTLGEWLHEQSPALGSAFDGLREGAVRVFNTVSDVWNNTLKPIVQEIIDFFVGQLGPTFQAFGNLVRSVWQNIIKPAFDAMHPLFVLIGQVIQNVWEGVIKPTWMAMVDNINILADGLNGFWDGVVKPIWDKLVELFNEVKPQLDQVVNAAKGFLSSIKSIFTSIYNAIKDPINKARDAVKSAIDRMKSFFNFKWELPKLALPHLSISGRFSISPPSVPKFSISWYKKAYDTPFLFTKPTVVPGFGDGGGSGEMVYGRDRLLSDIHEAAGSAENASLLASIYDRLAEILDRMERAVVLDDGTLVGKIAPKMDKGLNDVSDLMERGVSLA